MFFQHCRAAMRIRAVVIFFVIFGTLITSEVVNAQRRSSRRTGGNNSSVAAPQGNAADTPFQRWLPLPQGGNSDLRQQMMWLQQLQGLLAQTSDNSGLPSDKNSGSAPKLDAEQMRLLQKMIQQMTGAGGKSAENNPLSQPGNLTPEQVSKALADPETRDLLRQVLEGFSRNREMPNGSGSNTKPNLPLPSDAKKLLDALNRDRVDTSPSTQDSNGAASHGGDRSQKRRSDSVPGITDPSLANNQEPLSNPLIQDLLKRFESTAKSQKRFENRDDSTHSVVGPNGQQDSGSRPGNELSSARRPRSDNQDSSTSNSSSEGLTSQNSERSQASEKGINSSSANENTDLENRVDAVRSALSRLMNSAGQGDLQREGTNQDSSSRDRSTNRGHGETGSSNVIPRFEDGKANGLSSSRQDSINGVVEKNRKPGQGNGPETGMDRTTLDSSQKPSNNPSLDRDSLHKQAREIASNLLSRDSSNELQNRSSIGNREAENQGAGQRNNDSSSNNGHVGASSNSGNRRSFDVRSELEQRGFAETMKKLIDEAKAEAAVASRESSNSLASGPSSDQRSISGNGRSATGSSGVEGSLSKAFEGIQRDLGRISNGSTTQRQDSSGSSTPFDRGAFNQNRLSPTPFSPPKPSSEGKSLLGSAGKALNDLAKTVTTAPEAPRMATAAGTGQSLSGVAANNSLSVLGMLLLMVVLGAILLGLPRLMAVVRDSQQVALSHAERIRPADIRTRNDVIRAFHQFAMRPASPASSWWTHRDVVREETATAPALAPMVETLATVYEQARYEPETSELTAEQIDSVRQALEECERKGVRYRPT